LQRSFVVILPIPEPAGKTPGRHNQRNTLYGEEIRSRKTEDAKTTRPGGGIQPAAGGKSNDPELPEGRGLKSSQDGETLESIGILRERG